VHALHDGLVDMLYALLPLLAQAFGLSYAEVGMVRAANRMATATLQVPAGMLAERTGERPLLVAGTALAGIAFLGLGLAGGFPSVLALIFLAGVGAAVQHPLASSLITAAFPGTGRRAALGTYNTLGDVGKFGFMALVIGGAALGIGWQAVAAAFGLAALATAAAAQRLFVAAGAGARPSAPDRQAAGGAAALPARGWGVKSRTGLLALALIATLDSATRVGFLTFVAFLMIGKGVPAAWAASSVLLALLGGMGGKFACGVLAERIGVTRTIALSEAATGAAILAVVVLPGLWGFAMLPLLGLFLNGTSTAIYGTVGELIDDSRHSRAFGLIYTLGSVCGVVAPLAFGLLADAAGVAAALTASGLMILLAVPLSGALGQALAGNATRSAQSA